ncbi:hypothetical protein AX774_g7401 [Zancudomyces culisetae]|uniref:Uncharacterized protein n=1 Tax=Zancudomyces culisetae TaxID=1213189 RepID=A0A1R1PE63_ZANCU|nr:hypothetical protein AX774_g7401 [Zancudomyces culisetae]|eukprot:OMH79193.1 hypothetical protein AX774_g7401 [Zancudomyces culisetae]
MTVPTAIRCSPVSLLPRKVQQTDSGIALIHTCTPATIRPAFTCENSGRPLRSYITAGLSPATKTPCFLFAATNPITVNGNSPNDSTRSSTTSTPPPPFTLSSPYTSWPSDIPINKYDVLPNRTTSTERTVTVSPTPRIPASPLVPETTCFRLGSSYTATPGLVHNPTTTHASPTLALHTLILDTSAPSSVRRCRITTFLFSTSRYTNSPFCVFTTTWFSVICPTTILSLPSLLFHSPTLFTTSPSSDGLDRAPEHVINLCPPPSISLFFTIHISTIGAKFVIVSFTSKYVSPSSPLLLIISRRILTSCESP